MTNEMLKINNVSIRVFKLYNEETEKTDLMALYHNRKDDSIIGDIVNHFLDIDADWGELNIITIPWTIKLKNTDKIFKYLEKVDEHIIIPLNEFKRKE